MDEGGKKEGKAIKIRNEGQIMKVESGKKEKER